MTKKELYEVIKAEIEWCENDENRTMPKDWQSGFIAGLRQAIRIIKNHPLNPK